MFFADVTAPPNEVVRGLPVALDQAFERLTSFGRVQVLRLEDGRPQRGLKPALGAAGGCFLLTGRRHE